MRPLQRPPLVRPTHNKPGFPASALRKLKAYIRVWKGPLNLPTNIALWIAIAVKQHSILD